MAFTPGLEIVERPTGKLCKCPYIALHHPILNIKIQCAVRIAATGTDHDDIHPTHGRYQRFQLPEARRRVGHVEGCRIITPRSGGCHLLQQRRAPSRNADHVAIAHEYFRQRPADSRGCSNDDDLSIFFHGYKQTPPLHAYSQTLKVETIWQSPPPRYTLVIQ